MVTVLTPALQHARWLGLLCLLLLAACTPSYVAVAGTATINTSGDPEDRHALEYPIGARDARRGKIELWSDGAEREELDGTLQTLVHVGMVVHNTSNEPLRLEREQLRLDEVLLENGDIHSAPLATFDGELRDGELRDGELRDGELRDGEVRDGEVGSAGDPEVPPGASRRYQAYFRLPARVWPDDILAYHFTWAVKDSGGTHPQATNFRRSDYDRRVYVGIYPAYPGYYPWGYYPWVYPTFRFGIAPSVFRYGPPRAYPRAYPPRVYARPRRR